MNMGALFFEVMESRPQWTQQLVSFKTSEKWDLLWTKKSKAHDKEILDKFFFINYIPTIEEFIEHEFIQGAIAKVINYQTDKKKLRNKKISPFFYGNFLEPKSVLEEEKPSVCQLKDIYKYQGIFGVLGDGNNAVLESFWRISVFVVVNNLKFEEAQVFGEPILDLVIDLPDTLSKFSDKVSYRKLLQYLNSKPPPPLHSLF